MTIHVRALPGAGARAGVLTLAIALMGATGVQAGQPGAVVPLPDRMRTAADTYLPGVVGQPVPGFTIDAGLASLSPGTKTYAIVSGPNAGTTEQHTFSALPRDKSGTGWRCVMGDRTLFLRDVPGESLSVVTEQDAGQGVMTKYSPAQPLLIAGMNPGDQQSMTLKLDVFDLDDPSDLEHSGSLNLTLTYVGAYQVTVPAGTYDAALLVWDFDGKVGPAKIEDVQARFVVPGVGMVAAAEKRDVAAMLIYNDNSKVGKVLQQP